MNDVSGEALQPLEASVLHGLNCIAGIEHSSLLVAVSGGADSVALLHVLHALSSRLALRLAVAHFDHRARLVSGDESEFVRSQAASLGYIVIMGQAGRALASESDFRDARYDFLRSAVHEWGGDWLVLGHTLDDQAETVLLRLARGSGLHGLAGMTVVSGRLLRPLLGVRHAETVGYCRARRIPWSEDPSNDDVRFARNRLRRFVLPQLELINPRASSAIARAASLAAEDEALLEGLIAPLLRTVMVASGRTVTISLDTWRGALVPLRRRFLRHAVGVVSPHTAPSLAQIESVLRNVERIPTGGMLDGLGSVQVYRERSELVIEPARLWSSVVEENLPVPGTLRLQRPSMFGRIRVTLREGAAAPALSVRCRRPGDRYQPDGAPEPRKLSDLLSDAGIPRRKRDSVPVVCLTQSPSVIVWVAGLPPARWPVGGLEAPVTITWEDGWMTTREGQDT